MDRSKQKRRDGGWAFPHDEIFETSRAGALIRWETNHGMSLRDWFAGMVLTNIDLDKVLGSVSAAKIASRCYLVADAMIEERRRG